MNERLVHIIDMHLIELFSEVKEKTPAVSIEEFFLALLQEASRLYANTVFSVTQQAVNDIRADALQEQLNQRLKEKKNVGDH